MVHHVLRQRPDHRGPVGHDERDDGPSRRAAMGPRRLLSGLTVSTASLWPAGMLPVVADQCRQRSLNRGSVGEVGVVRAAGGTVRAGGADMELGAGQNVADQGCGGLPGVDHLRLTEILPVFGILQPDQQLPC